MIASVSGTILKIGSDHLVVDVHGLGLRVFVPRTVLENVGSIGRGITLHTHFVIRENEMALYGFKQEDELALFEVLLTVNGVGPKVGLAILSTLSPDLLKTAIMREDSGVLQRVPGIGKKTAERMMFQLRDKLDFSGPSAANIPLVTDTDAEVIDFLTALGFSIVEAQAALQKIPRTVQSVEERVQLALQYLGQN